MNPLLLYLLMLKCTVLSLNGQSSLPLVRDEFVLTRGVLTDAQLSAAVAVAQSSPGPMGGFVVSAGYFIAGFPGAAVAWLALVTPAFLAIPVMRFGARHVHQPRVQSALNAMIVAGSALIFSTAAPLAREARVLENPWAASIAAGAFALVAFTRIPTVWAVLGGALLWSAVA